MNSTIDRTLTFRLRSLTLIEDDCSCRYLVCGGSAVCLVQTRRVEREERHELDFLRDVTQIGLESAQHALHPVRVRIV
jgi:hypothetical protein